jgi:cyclopropane-fatty-acyl-phospholipid synthase
MEIVKSLPKATEYNFYRTIVLNLLVKMNLGKLTVTLPEGQTIVLGNTDEMHANIKINDNVFFKKVLISGDVGFGESYVDGDWDTTSITNVIKWTILNVENMVSMSGNKRSFDPTTLLNGINKVFHKFNKNTKSGSKKNIEYHYDLSNDFYKLWLDDSMTYSSGVFTSQETTLKESQENKYKALADKLELKQTDHVLEIGTGWGGFSTYIAKEYGCRVTTTTISEEQYKYSKDLIISLGLENQITLLKEDYRNLVGTFDKVASIEMIEAVGHEFLPSYFETCANRLKPDGIFALQVITSPDSRYTQFKDGVDWIQKHIFPGSLLPAVGEMNRVINKVSDLHLLKFDDYGHHYARTLNHWFNNFNDKLIEVKELGFDNEFIRKWNYYLNYCEAAFEMRNISVVQLAFTRPNNTKISKEF